MTTYIRRTITLAMVMIATSFSAFAQSPSSSVIDDEIGHLKVLQSERFFDDSAYVRGSGPLAPEMLPATNELREILPSLSRILTEKSALGPSAELLIPGSPAFRGPLLQTSQQAHYRVPIHTGSMRERQGREFRISRKRFDSGDLHEDAKTPEGQFALPNAEFMTQERVSDATFPAADQDHFFPPTAPDGQQDDDKAVIDELITMRYQNPTTARVIRMMGGGQSVQLFSEVSQLIDERALHPTSYDLRVRRALRNLTIALDNRAFMYSLGLTADSPEIDEFRNTLHRMADSDPVRNHQQAVNLLNKVMAQAQVKKWLTPAALGFEFTNASIDTLDKFSALEPLDPALQHDTEKEALASDGLDEEIVGIGLEVREHTEGLIVIKPLRGGPAAEAGIEPGDIIRNIDDRDIRGMRIVNSMDLLRGPNGSQMKLRIDHDGDDEREVVLTRRIVRVWTVNDTKILSGTGVGYFSLSRFARSSTAEVDETLNRLHRDGMKSLILDLRGDPGGLLTTCIEISDRFVPCGIIVSTKGRLSADNMVQTATYERTWSVPLVVLIDGDSASASEIFAAAIQENKRGIIVGTHSYGKGTVQTHLPLSSIRGNLRLTTARFYSPSGRTIAGTGVIPDVDVEDLDGVMNGDKVLAEAVQFAQSQTLIDMAKASAVCRPQNPSAVKSSSLKDIVDPGHPGTTVL